MNNGPLSLREFEEKINNRCCLLMLDWAHYVAGDTLIVIVDGAEYTLKVEWSDEKSNE